MDPRDRRAKLLESGAPRNGIDFVEVTGATPPKLRVHFLNPLPLKGDRLGTPTITGGERIQTVTVKPVQDSDWGFDGGHLVLTLTARAPGDFSNYTLTIDSPRLDPFFTTATFSFKALCPSDLDCGPRPAACPPVADDAPPIDYLAKDFLGFRQALLDFSAQRYPRWQERSEADFGVMFLEALSALADDLSYTQDRVAAEAALDTATQRRSVVRHARLVDYEPRPATAARTLLQFDVAPEVEELADGLRVSATLPDGGTVAFETGTTLADRLIDPQTGDRRAAPPSTTVSTAWNAGIPPYWLDDSQRCLRSGATEMYVLGAGYDFRAEQQLLIETQADTTADPPVRQVVQLLGDDNRATEMSDPLFPPPAGARVAAPAHLLPAGSPPDAGQTAFTLIRWRAADALLVDRDLTRTTLAGNLVPATQAVTVKANGTNESFVIPPPQDEAGDEPQAVVRTGPNDTPEDPVLQYLYTLRLAPVAWLSLPALPGSPPPPPAPEIVLTGPAGGEPRRSWRFVRRLLDAGRFEPAFTLDAARYAPTARLTTPTATGGRRPLLVQDYDGDGGDTVRFGAGDFGAAPLPGDRFEVEYRVGGGAAGNVAADSVVQVDPSDPQSGRVLRVTNPFPAEGGADPEPLDRVRRLAPQQFRAVRLNAVIPADYQDAADALPWVQRAGTVFRWTGSWLTVFTTPDPLHSEQVTIDQRTELIDLLNRRRMAGYESYVPDPRYLSLDIVVEVCARPDAFRGDVERAVLEALTGSAAGEAGTSGAAGGFFDPDRFTFGQPLLRSALEAAVQAAPGVAGVTCVRYRARGRTTFFAEMPLTVAVGTDEIIRCDNDPSLPERGSLRVVVKGGK